MDRPTLVALLALIALPGSVLMTLRDVRLGRDARSAPRQTATVRNKYITGAGRTAQHWLTVEMPGGTKWNMSLPGTEWGLQRVGAPMTVAVLSGGEPMSIHAGVNPSSKWIMLAAEAAGFVAAVGYLGSRFLEGRRVSDLSPEAELARRAERERGEPMKWTGF